MHAVPVTFKNVLLFTFGVCLMIFELENLSKHSKRLSNLKHLLDWRDVFKKMCLFSI